MKEIILESKGLCKSYKNGEVVSHVIRNLDVEVLKGDFTVIMGTSGAGKSTLLYLLSGIDKATSGEIALGKKKLNMLKEKEMLSIRRKDIGFVFQEPNLLEDFNAFENIAMSGYLLDKNKKKVNDRTNQLLERVGMVEHQSKYPSQLSGGQKQRIAIARSLINSPAIVYADEPTGALNATQSEAVLELLTEANENGQSILMVTHEIKAAARGNRILFIKDGKIDGILNLDQFKIDLIEEREKMIFEFIIEKGW